ncbi:hypothetical protein [Halosimplex pelagicum]|uniref:Uncharacterized protein n=1 Tax=Halosimplex pelagicum TaxID=869886 RepID=A0A7D5T2S8_9EURY|nr:hypothetical protein [Halosimplex pelagicum]QLH80148.1 hypothetical protein HZS54_00250 [Halosimplex pelagicum]
MQEAEALGETVERNGVTFVTATVSHDRGTAQVVRLENRLDGPVWPPRVGDQTAPAWTDGTWEARVGPDQALGVGYATPAPPLEDGAPLSVVSVTRAGGTDGADPEAVLASLDDWSPPSDALDR